MALALEPINLYFFFGMWHYLARYLFVFVEDDDLINLNKKLEKMDYL